jgi:antitoxin MazE
LGKIVEWIYVRSVDPCESQDGGNSLAVRLPSTVVKVLDLKEGDQIEIGIAGRRSFEVSRDRSKEKALEKIRRLRRPLPPGFEFDRQEANER